MSKSGEIRYVLTSSNTSQGFHTFIPDLIQGLRKIYILKGATGSGKSTFIRLLGESLSEKGYEIEFWISALDPVSPDGVYIPRLGTAVINGSLPQPIDPRYPEATGHIIYLGDYRNHKGLNGKAREIIDLIDRQEEQSVKAFEILKVASQVRKELKQAARDCLSMANIRELIEELARELLREQPGERHYFASAVTADGIVNYIDEISYECKRRYILIGPSGSGKSLVITELARRAREKGYFLEYYHCGFDLESIVMVIIPNLQLALIDGGNMELAIKPWDIVIDMEEYLENYDAEAATIKSSEARRNYESLLLEAEMKLENAHAISKELKKIFTAFMDFEQLDRKRQEVLEDIINTGSRPQFL